VGFSSVSPPKGDYPLSSEPPVILVFAPLDPAGRAGVMPIAETLASLGCHAVVVPTAYWRFSSSDESLDAMALCAFNSAALIQQARALLEDMPVKAVVIGFAGSILNLEAIHSLLQDYAHLPVINNLALYPFETARASDTQATCTHYAQALTDLILPLSDLTLCDDAQLGRLPGSEASCDRIHPVFQHACRQLLAQHCEPLKGFVFRLYRDDTLLACQEWSCAKLPPTALGVEDVLLGALAGFRAHGSDWVGATTQSLHFAEQAAKAARQIGFASPIPHRLFWSQKD
jgi:hydroxymethylpyrimidine/phosphomethylpyrimidine kinase